LLFCVGTLIIWDRMIEEISEKELYTIKSMMRILPGLAIIPIINTILAIIIITVISQV